MRLRAGLPAGTGRARRRAVLVRDNSGSASNSSVGKTRRHKPDYWLIILCSLLLTTGIIVVYSISPGLAAARGVSDNYYVSKQLIAVALGVVSFIAAAAVPASWWRKAAPILIGLCLIGSVIALITPLDQTYQAHRWVRFGGLSFQVAELIKLTLLAWVAGFLTGKWQQGVLHDSKKTLKPLVIALFIIGVLVAWLQSDLGSAGVMAVMIGAMMFVVGVPLKPLIIALGVILISTLLLISTSSYRRDRFLTFVHPERDCQAAGYQACQALITVGSGGLIGLGLGSSVQAYGYLPEAANDSIFAIMAEKFGFIGISIVLGLYVAFIARLKRIVEHTNDQYSRLLVVGVLAWFSTQAVINIGAMIGLLPLKGITLPFVSAGGTSLLFMTAALGLVFRVSRYTSYSAVEPENNDKQTLSDSHGGRGVGRPYNPGLVSRPRT